MREIDLHCHTNISDGSETPEETVRYARSLGLRAIAITDHDTTDGVKRAQSEGEKCGLEVVAGLELGCGWYGTEVHMLGYDIDPDNERLKSILKWVVDDRNERNAKMAKILSDDGIRIDLDELEERYSGSVIGRPHFAVCLVEAGLCDSVLDAFRRYLDPGRKYYVRRQFLEIEEAAAYIADAGGKAVIAHPGQYRLDDDGIKELLTRASKAGVSGLECYYSGYSQEKSAEYLALAERYGLAPTAGSDWHGTHKPHIKLGSGINGELNAPYKLLKDLRAHTAR